MSQEEYKFTEILKIFNLNFLDEIKDDIITRELFTHFNI